eukprot:11786342-Alexandrium_andersonii.AAC.1
MRIGRQHRAGRGCIEASPKAPTVLPMASNAPMLEATPARTCRWGSSTVAIPGPGGRARIFGED